MIYATEETATVLMNLYNEKFGSDYVAPFKLTWDQMRRIAGVDKLTDEYLASLNEDLMADDYALLVFNNFFIVAAENDFSGTRSLTSRLVERCISDEKEDDDEDDDLGDFELPDDEDEDIDLECNKNDNPDEDVD